MRIGIIGGVTADAEGTIDGIVRQARALEAQGFATFWLPNIFGLDAITTLPRTLRDAAEASPRVAELPLPQEGKPQEAVGGAARRFWRWMVLVLLLAAVAVVIALARPWERHDRAGSGGPWGIAVDMGCQPTEVERLYRRQGQDRDNLRLSKFANGRETCFRLVWGHYRDRQAAEQAMKTLPASVIGRGFAPHVVMVEPVSP